ncbi:uncharacterized protein LOC116197992 isoform X2 [Punica granatum]|uniref:ENT domain-containing protein n=2 Tax=Punica granatum TaxID=22663 RepID=A0A218WHM7_PUNGR|nr:uncharacterized protein LOC116197992 isoform X1 [Punica granatum]XP_031384144.1 uncharacterized protein LOC116197992 isoform X1 [Punica granatum]XP_031384145.1 uncharacterized protein LOC116197992 isoform X1 [Punica granatum]XP_031384146.1 uncharacterized protein LOC116197992 isoform X1 [Punica granatum]XP_031384147.1 uncharacterized protein LOC116197992 isoform X2 [Punica granatum]OWM71721.1 hypothetical protein CDL15_Pgr005909 [Punica granatum]PKI75713.1 hypothetical protein CRG98_003856
MRFTRGTRVEVLDRKELLLGSWRCGEIISSNGRTCTVRYYSPSRKNALAKVSGSVLRPCPPHLGIRKEWASGDVLEVLNDYSWRMAKVMKSLGGDSYVVRVLGTSEEFRVDVSETRVRQSWNNGKWIIIGQVSGVANERKQDDQVRAETPKRESSYLYHQAGGPKKRRVCAKERISSAEVDANRAKLPELIDVSLRIQDSAASSSCSISHAESNNNDDTCSIGSCSITDDKYCRSSPKFSGPAEGNMSDAESFSHGRYKAQKDYVPPNSGEGSEAEVHNLELRAYRRTMEALYASGALSWEKESLMSNLRVSLNISSDEHLTELRVLLSASNDTPFR